MAEYNRPTNEQEFEQNFAQKKPLMNDTEAYYESSRCLFCYDAPCMNACPTHIDIPLFIKQIHTGNVEGSAKTIFDSNWMGNACGKVCPTSVLCEGACVYNHQHVKPIEIGRLQNFATLKVIQQKTKLFEAGKDNGKKVLVIGAGAAGISCASELRVLGYSVDIFESKSQPSGLTVHGVAPYKISNQEALEEIEYLQNQLGFTIHYNHAVTTSEELKKCEEKYDAIFLGVGLGKTANLKEKGEDLENVIGAVEFIEMLRAEHHKAFVPERVVIMGGGNTAMDAASECARMGAKNISLCYRRSKDEMGAYKFEYDLAVSSGVKSIFNVTPVEIYGNGKVESVKFIRTILENGILKNIEGSEFTIDCDMVIKATGQAKQGSLYQLISGLEIDRQNRVVVKDETYQTSLPNYFAGGDAVNGGAEVVNAAYEGKMAALGIHKFINSK